MRVFLFQLHLETGRFASTTEEPQKMGGRLRKNSAEEVHEQFMDLFMVKENNDSFSQGVKLLFGQHRGRCAEDSAEEASQAGSRSLSKCMQFTLWTKGAYIPKVR